MNSEIQEIIDVYAFEIYEFSKGANINVLRDFNTALHHYKHIKIFEDHYDRIKYGWWDDDRIWWLINFDAGINPIIKTTAKKVKYYTPIGTRIDVFEEDKRILYKIKR